MNVNRAGIARLNSRVNRRVGERERFAGPVNVDGDLLCEQDGCAVSQSMDLRVAVGDTASDHSRSRPPG